MAKLTSASRPEAPLSNSAPAQPFLKWPWGKRWIASEICDLIRPRLVNRYFEPFLGGAAVFFHLCPRRAVLSDVNGELIRTYEAVRDDWRRIVAHLKQMRVTRAEYNDLRLSQIKGKYSKAARFLYLNRTAFGGIYRLNRSGEFNVPFGGARTPAILWQRGLLRQASCVLRDVELVACDFEVMLDRAGIGDVAYCDPTYTVTHENNGFIRYNEANFSWVDQERLAAAAKRARARGALVVVSNAHHEAVHKLYKNANIITLSRNSLVSRDLKGRKVVHEYLFILG